MVSGSASRDGSLVVFKAVTGGQALAPRLEDRPLEFKRDKIDVVSYDRYGFQRVHTYEVDAPERQAGATPPEEAEESRKRLNSATREHNTAWARYLEAGRPIRNTQEFRQLVCCRNVWVIVRMDEIMLFFIYI